LVLNANTGGLAPGQYLANVTIASPDAGVSNQQRVRVGLVVGAADPVASIDIGSVISSHLVAGPVEPVLFVATGASIRVYDVNSGTLLRTLNAAFSEVATLTVSDDGLQLFVVEEQSGTDPVVRVLDPVSGAVQDTYQMTLPTFTSLQVHSLQYARPNGHPVLLSAGRSLDAFDVATGMRSLAVLEGPAITLSSDHGYVYAQNNGFSPSTITAYRLRYSALPGVGILIDNLTTNRGDGGGGVRSNGQDVAIAPDGAHLYVAAGAPYQFDILDAPSLVYSGSRVGDAFPNNVETCWNGLFAGGANLFDPGGDIWIYNASGTLRDRVDSGAQLTQGALIFSGDCTRVISASDSGLRIQSAPAP
jgi:DNA-binding beta-propeller fold protein YncE